MKFPLSGSLALLTCFVCGSLPLTAAEHSLRVSVAAGKTARVNTPVTAEVELPLAFSRFTTAVAADAQGKKLPAQITRPSVLTQRQKAAEGKFNAELHFIASNIAAGETQTFTVSISDQGSSDGDQFKWVDTSVAKGPDQPFHEQSRELRFGSRPVIRYMHSALDESTSEIRMSTYKPYHHVYDPSGTRFVTKGPGGKFPHHRGLYFGFNRISYEREGKKLQADTWHCNKGEDQSHAAFQSEDVGPVVGRHAVSIEWHGQKKDLIAVETREITAYSVAGGTLVQFANLLETKAGAVRLDGDPQHAGFHFRASQEVPDKTASQTYYVRPDGRDVPGKFRNWPADKQHVNLAWNALSFVLGDARYTCCMLDRPGNPKEARFSERDYGRFGSYFEYDLTAEKPLRLAYRVWLQNGELTPEQIQPKADDFVSPPEVKIE